MVLSLLYCQHLVLTGFVPLVKFSQSFSPCSCVTSSDHFTAGHFLNLLENISKGKFIQLGCNTTDFVPRHRLSGDNKGPPRPQNISQGAGEV